MVSPACGSRADHGLRRRCRPGNANSLTLVRKSEHFLGTECGLYIDVALEDAVAPGDWVATEAGARYLVLSSRLVRSRLHAQRNRFQLRCARLERDVEPPDDVVTWWMRWYSRDRRG